MAGFAAVLGAVAASVVGFAGVAHASPSANAATPKPMHLNDSGYNSGCDEQVLIATFEKSWATRHNFVVVTR